MTTATEVKVTFPDGSQNAVARGTTLLEVAQSLGAKFVKESVAGKINGRLVDLSSKLDSDATLELILVNSPEAREVIRHSTAHIMASAVKELFPDAKVTIGPAIDDGVNGFYYDFDYERGFNEEDLERIVKKMDEIIKQDMPFQRQEVSREEARKIFSDQGESYKLELLEAIPAGEKVSLYRHANFVDLCRGPHVPSTGRVKAYKLLAVAGAYWRGDSRNKMLARIYGTAFANKDELKNHVARIEEAKKRDHRLLGKQLDLFSFSPAVGGGLVLWHPKGAKVRYLIEEFWRQTHFDYGYELVNTPHIGKAELWETSGHLGFYRQNMYAPMDIDGNPFYVKPMNCPFHIEIYRSKLRSYRDLPIRFAELGTVYRYEASGVLHGLMRVRGFTQDDAHIFCRGDQLDHEIRRCLEHTFFLLRAFGFEDFKIFVSTRPEKFVGDVADWEKATETLKSALQSSNLAYEIDPGEGVFYGPKIDIKIKDSLGRTWQCSTIQVDFNLPQRFSVEYVDRDNARSQPFMVHRALLGSLERFFGVLIEHHAGAFPVWLAPVQAIVLPLTDAQVGYARSVSTMLAETGVRVEVDERNEKLGYKIREAQLAKIPYMLVVGNREVEQSGVAVRKREGKDLGFVSKTELLDLIKKEAVFPQRPIIKEG
jgi:threonyl-tRNA synthetase